MKIFNTLANLLVYLSYCLTFLNFGIIRFDLSPQVCGEVLGIILFLAICLHFCYWWMQKKKGFFDFIQNKTNKNTKSNQIKVINFWFWQIMTILGSILYFTIAVFCFSPGSQQIQICFYVLLPLIFVLNCVSSVLESMIRIRFDLANLNPKTPVKPTVDK